MKNKEFIDYSTKLWINLFIIKSNLNQSDIEILQECIKKIIETTIEWKNEHFKTKIVKLFNELENAGYNDRVKSGFEIFKNKIDEEILKEMEE